MPMVASRVRPHFLLMITEPMLALGLNSLSMYAFEPASTMFVYNLGIAGRRRPPT